jgi:membrane-associated HD superfamily phosphohydrolase
MAKNESSYLRNKRKEERRRADDRFTWRVLSVIFFLCLWTFLLYFFNWPTILYILPAGASVLYLLAFIYPRDFTVLAVYISCGALGLWLLTLLGQRSGRWNPLAYAVFAAAIVLSALCIWRLYKRGGSITVRSKTLSIMPRKGRYVFLVIACCITALALTAAIFFGGTAASFSIIALFCYLFIAAVYYTVKLI